MSQSKPTSSEENPAAEELQANTAMAFGTPIATHSWPDSDTANASLRDIVLAEEQVSPGMERSNVGAWHSDLLFLQKKEPAVVQLVERIKQMTGSITRAVTVDAELAGSVHFSLQGWATVLRDSGYNMVHNHPNSLWSGVYFVSAGEPDERGPNNGKLELLDPRAGINMVNIRGTIMEGRYLVQPLSGLMVIFPSWLSHFVHPFFGQGERISIAFNIVSPKRASKD